LSARSIAAMVGSLVRPEVAIRWRQLVLRITAAVLVLAALGGGLRYYVWALHHESTDDAFIDCHPVHVAPRVAGRVQRVLVTDNQLVQEGELLVEIDPTDFQVQLDDASAARNAAAGRQAAASAQVGVAQAAEAQAEADIVAARADADNAATDLARYRATISGAVSKQSLDAASTTAKRSAAGLLVKQKAKAAATAQIALARAQLDESTAEVASAEAKVRQMALQLSYTQIHAKETGRVTRKSVTTGDYVQIGQEIFALVPTHVWVAANFKETQLRYMRPGQPVTIHVDAYHGDFPGRVDSVQAGSGSFFSLLPPENATGNYVKVVQRVPVKIVFERATDEVLLGPGMSVEPTVELQ